MAGSRFLLDDDLGGTDGQLGDLAPEVGDGLRLGRLDVGRRPGPHLGQLGLEPGLLVALQRVGRLAGLLDDATGLGLGVGELRPGTRRARASASVLARLGRVEVGADPLGAGLHALLDRRAGELPACRTKSDDEGDRRPRAARWSAGRIGLGASWQSSTEPPSTRIGMHSTSASVRAVLLGDLLGVVDRPPRLARRARPRPPGRRRGARRRRARRRAGRSPALRGCGIARLASSAGDDEREDEAEQGEGFGEGDAEEHGGADHAGGLGLAGHGA